MLLVHGHEGQAHQDVLHCGLVGGGTTGDHPGDAVDAIDWDPTAPTALGAKTLHRTTQEKELLPEKAIGCFEDVLYGELLSPLMAALAEDSHSAMLEKVALVEAELALQPPDIEAAYALVVTTMLNTTRALIHFLVEDDVEYPEEYDWLCALPIGGGASSGDRAAAFWAGAKQNPHVCDVYNNYRRVKLTHMKVLADVRAAEESLTTHPTDLSAAQHVASNLKTWKEGSRRTGVTRRRTPTSATGTRSASSGSSA